MTGSTGLRLVYESHSTTVDNEAGIATGWLPGRLSARGRTQASALGARRRDDGIDLVICSPLRRAVDTAGIAFGDTPIEVMRDARLRECDYGDRNGAPVGSIRPALAYLDDPFPGGESYRQVVARTADFLADLGTRRDLRRVVLVAHSAQRWSLRHLLGGENLHDVLAGRDAWQPGWEFDLPYGWSRCPH